MVGNMPASVLHQAGGSETFTRTNFFMWDPTERNGCSTLVKSKMKVYPILGLGFVYPAKYLYGLHAVLPGPVVVFNTFIFAGRGRAGICASAGEGMNGNAVFHPTLREWKLALLVSAAERVRRSFTWAWKARERRGSLCEVGRAAKTQLDK